MKLQTAGRAPPARAVRDVLSSPGQPLETATRATMEPQFGFSFANVRVHTDARASASARAVSALAYTVGRDVVFGAGRYAPGSAEGRRLIAHELAHVVEHERGAPLAVRRQVDPQAICWDPTAEPESEAPDADPCTPRTPEDCPTYAQWLSGFRRLRTFSARDTAAGGSAATGFDVLGGGAASHDPAAPADEQPAPFVGPGATDSFIDHPTDAWVRTCLPENLREDAYRLPSDCADIAVILRHVWLSAHHRTETFGHWTIGDRAGGAARAQIGQVIGEVYSGNVASMVAPYADAAGHPLRSFAALAPLLHEGDVLVWEHHDQSVSGPRSGGHTQTITRVERDPSSGAVLTLGVVQGNQPIGPSQATEIAGELGSGAPSASTMRNWAGRRIESAVLEASELTDVPVPVAGAGPGAQPAQVWSNDGTTTLVAAGPPRAAARPAAHREHGQTVRRVTDWVPTLRAATADTLPGTLESALQELRAALEGGTQVADADAVALGRAEGEGLWARARAAGGRGEDEHFRPVQEMQAVIHALGHAGSSNPALVGRVFDAVWMAFGDAARGGTTVDFARPARTGGGLELKMLVTGFDPFEPSGSLAPPARGEWNPSGAAALALDGTTVEGPGRVRTAVESLVLPVSRDEFAAGIVERLVPAAHVDAVVTVSLDPNLADADPVRLERYAVGVHATGTGIEPVPNAPGRGSASLIVESTGPVDDIARDTAQPAATGRPAVVRPTTGDEVQFGFGDVATADAALLALGQPAQTGTPSSAVWINPAVLPSNVHPDPNQPTGLVFTAGGVEYHALVLASRGGNFLSNEVSYRVLRLLGQQHAADSVDRMSFHVHTPGASPIPQDTSTATARADRAEAVSRAAGIRTQLIATLRRVIRATAGRLAALRPP